MKKCFLAAILVLAICFLGCGGGGGDSSSGDTSSSSSSSSSGGGNPNATISGKIVNEGGAGIPNTSITISGVSSSTDESGNFTVGSLVVGTEYFLDISYPERKTAHMKFTIQDYNPNLIVAITLPKGNGEASFELPASPNLSITTSGNIANLSWTPTSYANFIAYGLYRAEHTDVRSNDEERGIRLAPNNTTYQDPIISGTNYYYRIFEKDTIAELGATVMIGSNEVQTIYPVMESYSPTGNDVAVNSPITIAFSREMNQESVNNGFSIVSSYSGDSVISGTKTWNGNTFTFTPDKSFGYGRTFTVSLLGAKDFAGNVLSGNTSWFFSRKSGYVFSSKWGSGQFDFIRAVAMDSSENVYVVDYYNHRIQKFTSSGTFITKWGSFGDGDGQLNYPYSITVDPLGDVYVADMSNNRIQKFTSSGTFISKWGSQGSGDEKLSHPTAVAADSLGNVYVAEGNSHLVKKFTSTGIFITKWNIDGCSPCVVVDSSGNVYVVDNSYIKKFTSSGTFITKWGSQGIGDGQFACPYGITIDPSGDVYVTDDLNDRIQKFTSSGTFISKWGSQGSGDGQFNRPTGVVVDSSGNVYVAEANNNRIQKFIPDP